MAVPLIAAGIGLLGSALTSSAQRQAADTAARAQVEAANIAARESRFRPVGVTTAFGSSQFGFDPEGRLISAGYTLTPEMQAIRDRLLTQAGTQGLETAEQGQLAGQGLFGLGRGYLAQTPEQAAQQFMQRQQDLLAPSRERALAGVRQGLFNTGRTGLAVGATGLRPGGGEGLRAANPEMEAYYNALAQQDAELAARSMEQGREQTRFGAGLLSSGLNLQSMGLDPLKAQLGLTGTIEQMGQGALGLGSELGGRVTSANQAAASGLLTAGSDAARLRFGANQYSPVGSTLMGLSNNPQFAQGVGNMLGYLGTNTMGNPIYNPYLRTGGFSGTALENIYSGTSGFGD